MADIFGSSDLFSDFDTDRKSVLTSNLNQSQNDSDDMKCEVEGAEKSDSDSSEWDSDNDAGNKESKSNKKNGADTGGTVPLASSQNCNQLEKERSKNEPPLADGTNSVPPDYKQLQEQVGLLESGSNCPEGANPSLQILFHNENFARKHRADIETFIQYLYEKDAHDDVKTQPYALAQFHQNVSLYRDPEETGKKSKVAKRKWRQLQVLGGCQFYECFLVDRLGWPVVQANSALTDGICIPTYDVNFTYWIPHEGEPVAKKKKSGPSCWNCDGDHTLSDCPQPRDQAKIAQARREQQSRGPKVTLSGGRYAEKMNQEKNFKPGEISPDLREALGLHEVQLPPWIYRMRSFGYPPGWLITAKEESSGLLVHDKDGLVVDQYGQSLEDGEVNRPALEADAVVYRKNTIVEYPGFNIPIPEGIVDEHGMYGAPPMMMQQSKMCLEAYMEMKTQAATRHMEGSGNPADTPTPTAAEMEIENQVRDARVELPPPLPDTPTSPPPPLPAETPPRPDSSADLATLEDRRNEIMRQLKESQAEEGENNSPEGIAFEVVDEVGDTDTEGVEADAVATPVTNRSISVNLGTPLTQRSMELPAIPSAEKFTKDVTEHIPYENLPGAVGTFEKMKSIISKVREMKGKKS